MTAHTRAGPLALRAVGAGLLATSVIGCGGMASTPAPPQLLSGKATSRASKAGASGGILVRGPVALGPTWRPAVTVNGRVAVSTARRSGVTLMRLDQRVVHLALHAGRVDPGGSGWTYGDRIGRRERSQIVAAFNGGFKFVYGSVGFRADGRSPVPLTTGLASVVTYRNGMTQIGTWKAGVPARGVPIASVRQNLTLLVDHGVLASNVSSCIQQCWGGTVAYLSSVARSALGIDGAGRLVWAAGAHLTPAQLGRGLVSAGVLRALELDINRHWVAGYLYRHHAAKLAAVQVVPGQVGIYGHFLKSYSRDFFTVLTNSPA